MLKCVSTETLAGADQKRSHSGSSRGIISHVRPRLPINILRIWKSCQLSSEGYQVAAPHALGRRAHRDDEWRRDADQRVDWRGQVARAPHRHECWLDTGAVGGRAGDHGAHLMRRCACAPRVAALPLSPVALRGASCLFSHPPPHPPPTPCLPAPNPTLTGPVRARTGIHSGTDTPDEMAPAGLSSGQRRHLLLTPARMTKITLILLVLFSHGSSARTGAQTSPELGQTTRSQWCFSAAAPPSANVPRVRSSL